MVQKLVFQTIFLLLASLSIGLAHAAPPLANPGCNEKCGNITIPFPFGMGEARCFLDEWYEIVCQDDTLPRLKKIDLEVLNITLPGYVGGFGDWTGGTMSIRVPLAYQWPGCGDGTYKQSLSLEGSNFFFSHDRSIFISVGCDVSAWLNSSETAIIGCTTSRCKNSSSKGYESCSGIDGCCQTPIPSKLQNFSVDFKDEDMTQLCSYAYLVDDQWFNGPNRRGLLPDNAAFAVLEWGLSGNSSFYLSPDDRNNDKKLYDLGISCDSDNGSTSLPDWMQCYCRDGFEGNAYVEGGCQDINECEDPRISPSPCFGSTCVNSIGGYECLNGEHGRPRARIIAIGIGTGLGGLFLILLSWRLYKVIGRIRDIKLKKKYFKRNGGFLLEQQLSSPQGNVEKNNLFNYEDLDKATNHFHKDRVVGRGGQGTVYKGMLTDGRIVAIKKSIVDEVKVEQFINEVVILSQINHRNVVKLLGCCLETQVPLLVYEFIPNGTLYECLHDPNQESDVSWSTRLRIATEIAGALFYLHSAASIPIYHRDVMSTNILLDEKYRAKIADFGTSKSVSLDQTHVTTLVQGTFGYLDPEYFQSSHFTEKSDVYSFGVVLVELITGQKPISSLRPQGERSLAAYFIISMDEKCLFDIVDPHVLKEGKREEVMAVANLAKRCLNLHGRSRPTMKEVASELAMIMEPRNPTNSQQINQQGTSEADGFRNVGFRNDSAHIGIFSDEQPLVSCASR